MVWKTDKKMSIINRKIRLSLLVVFLGTAIGALSRQFVWTTIVRNTYVANYQAIQVAMIGTQLFGVRLTGLITFVPLFVLAYAAAFTDGLVQRSIRCAGGGNESANIYQRAKYFQVALIVSISALCLLWPLSIDFRVILLPGATLLVLLARYQWAYYKKHL